MSGKASLRRSRRSRVANQRYVNNDWSKDALRLIQGSSSELESEHDNPPGASDEDFDNADVQVLSENDNQEDANDESSVTSDEHASNIEEAGTSESDVVIEDKKLRANHHRQKGANAIDSLETLHTRGISTIDRKAGKTSVFQDTFGPGVEDVNMVVEAIDRWHLRARDVTRPSRATIGEALQNEWSRLELTSTEGGLTGSLLTSQQFLSTTTMDDLRSDHYISASPPQCVVLGATDKQKMYKIEYLKSFDFGNAWEFPTVSNPEPGVLQDNIEHSKQSESNMKSRKSAKPDRSHEGWFINVGEKVSSLAWCPLRTTPHDVQYLAVACRSTAIQRSRSTTDDQQRSQAFSPSPRFHSSIQIWQIPHQTDPSNSIRTINFDERARLSFILAMQVGDIIRVSWLPMPKTTSRSQDYLGSLVIISTDGCLRVVDVPSVQQDASLPILLKVESPSICIDPPPNAVFSTFTFASSEDIILGASNGEVCAYNLSRCRMPDEITPYLSSRLHHTYIMEVVTAGQRELSHFLASSSAAGDLRLTDLRSPHQDYIHTPRSRLPTRNLIYCPLTQSFVTTIDHSGRTEVQAAHTTVSALQLRHFYSQIFLSKFPNNTGTASAIAGSQLHPYILVGNTQGTVLCQNVIKKIIPKGGGCIQKLCEYEWMPAGRSPIDQHNPEIANISETDPSTEGTNNHAKSSTSLYYGDDTRAGISRFTEGFAIERQDLSGGNPSKLGKRSKKNTKKRKLPPRHDDDDEIIDDAEDEDGDMSRRNGRLNESSGEAIAEVIFEQENAVTAISWNENPHCAAWVAIGWGSGIVRIQDLSHDTK